MNNITKKEETILKKDSRRIIKQIEALKEGDSFNAKDYFVEDNRKGIVKLTTPNEIYILFDDKREEGGISLFSSIPFSKNIMAGISKEEYQSVIEELFLEKSINRLKTNPRRYKDIYREVKNKLVYPNKFKSFMKELYEMDLAKRVEVEEGVNLYFIK